MSRHLGIVLGFGVGLEALFVLLAVSGFTSGATPSRLAGWLPVLTVAWPAALFVALAAWWWLPRLTDRGALIAIVLLAAIFRVTVLPLPPSLSDDSYRYVWDGQVVLSGHSPYAHTPNDPRLDRVSAMTDGELRQRMNSADTFSVYPPVMQAVFASGAGLGELAGGGFGPAYLAIKTLITAFEIGSVLLLISLLGALGRDRRHALLYAWNPLPIMEYSGAGHTDAVMVFFLLLTLRLLASDRLRWAAVALAGAVLAKLLPVLLVPFFARKHGWKHVPLIGVLCVVGFLPLINAQVVENVTTSLRGYFGVYEFNNGIYWWLAGYFDFDSDLARKTTLGPVMAGLFVVFYAVVWLATNPWVRRRTFRARRLRPRAAARGASPGSAVATAWPLHTAALVIFSGYLVCTPVLHPWYLGFVLFLLPLRPMVSWLWMSGVAALTYTTYAQAPFAENLTLVAVEWLVFAALLLADLFHRPVLREVLRVRGGWKARAVAPYIIGRRVLDLGAAEGFVGRALADCGHEVELADVDDMNRTTLPLHVYDGRHLPFDDNSFDTVVIVLTLHHCDDPDAVLREAARVARHRLVITESTFHTAAGHWLLTHLDRLANSLRSGGVISEPINLRRVPDWTRAIEAAGLTVAGTQWLSRGIHQHILLAADKSGASRTAGGSARPDSGAAT